MKKPYNKPMIMVEVFSLSENIASCTPGLMNNLNITEGTLRNMGLFTPDENCEQVVTDGKTIPWDNGQFLCYHTSVKGSVIFSS
jgi:hypothetical protein